MSLLDDLRYAARTLRASPLFTATVVLVLALGVGAGTVIFGAVDAVLFRPFQAARPAEVVRVFATDEMRLEVSNHSYPVYTDYRDQADAFTGLAAYSDWVPVDLVVGAEGAERVNAGLASGSFFPVLDLPPTAGRLLGPADDVTRGGHPVVVLSERYWRRRFAGRAEAVGASLRINGHPFTVVGVAPTGFLGASLETACDLWLPMAMAGEAAPEFAAAALDNRRFSWIEIVGRLRWGVTAAQAQAQLDVIAARRAAAQPEGQRDPWALVLPAGEGSIWPVERQRMERTSWLLVGAVTLVLLVAGADVSGLLLARAERRRKEAAVRLALGASRARVARLMLAEGALLGVLGAGGGLLWATWGARLLRRFGSGLELPLEAATPVASGRALAVAAACGLLVALLAGLAPAVAVARQRVGRLAPALRGALVTLGSGSRRVPLRHLLVAVQAAVCALLLVGAGLLVRSLLAATRVDLGFDPDRVALAGVDLALQGYDAERGAVVLDRVLEAARALPGVGAAGLARWVPVQTSGMRITMRPQGYVFAPGEDEGVDLVVVSPGYFAALGVPLARGRDFAAGDGAESEPVAIVNQAFADRFWGGEGLDRVVGDVGGRDLRVVGVAATTKMRSVREGPRPALYLPLAQFYLPSTTVVVRAAPGTGPPRPELLLPALRAAVAAIDPDLPLVRPRTLRQQLGVALGQERTVAALVSSFGVLALVLAGAGLYGLVAYTVQLRTRELGVRLALGALPRDLVRLVARPGLLLTMAGLGAGLAASLAAGRLLAGFLFGVESADPATYLAAAAVLLAAALAAAYLPARRAARLQPMAVLREE